MAEPQRAHGSGVPAYRSSLCSRIGQRPQQMGDVHQLGISANPLNEGGVEHFTSPTLLDTCKSPEMAAAGNMRET